MASQELLLPEALVAGVTLERLLVGVNKHVGFEMPLADARIGTQVALKAFLSLVSLLVDFEGVAIGEGFPAHFAMKCPLRGVQLEHMQPEIRLTPAGRGTKLALKHRFVASVDQPANKQTNNVTLVKKLFESFLTCAPSNCSIV